LDWLRKESMQTFTTFLELITLSVETFQYSGKDKLIDRRNTAQPAKTPETPTRSSLQGRNSIRGNSGLSLANSIKYNKDTLRPEAAENHHHNKKRHHKEHSFLVEKRPVNFNIEVEAEVKLEGALATEVTMILLDVFDLILSHQNPKAAETPQSQKMFALLMKCLEVYQSEISLLQLFGTTKNFLFKVPTHFQVFSHAEI